MLVLPIANAAMLFFFLSLSLSCRIIIHRRLRLCDSCAGRATRSGGNFYALMRALDGRGKASNQQAIRG